MGIFNTLFKGEQNPKEEKQLPWIALTEVSKLDEIIQKSKSKTQIIFKHSTRCGISRMVMNQFVKAFNVDVNADLYYLDLLNFREVSNETGYKFQVIHESPQLLVIKNGVVVQHASHGDINSININTF